MESTSVGGSTSKKGSRVTDGYGDLYQLWVPVLWNALYSVAFRGNINIIGILMDAGADLNKIDGGSLGTPLDAARAMKRVSAIELLCTKGATRSSAMITGES